MVRREAFLGSLNTSPPPSLTRCNWRCTRRVLASKSISDHFKPNDSPILRPHIRDRTYKHSNLSPLAASRSARACCASKGVISSCLILGGRALAAGLRGISLSSTAFSKAQCKTA